MAVTAVILYTPFWDTLNRSNESTYTLIKNHRISSSIILIFSKISSLVVWSILETLFMIRS